MIFTRNFLMDSLENCPVFSYIFHFIFISSIRKARRRTQFWQEMSPRYCVNFQWMCVGDSLYASPSHFVHMLVLCCFYIIKCMLVNWHMKWKCSVLWLRWLKCFSIHNSLQYWCKRFEKYPHQKITFVENCMWNSMIVCNLWLWKWEVRFELISFYLYFNFFFFHF